MSLGQKQCERALRLLRESSESADSKWIRRHRKVDSERLVTCMLKSLHSKVSVRSVLDSIETCDFSGTAFQKAFRRCPESAFKHIYRGMTLESSQSRRRILAVDGSKIPLEKSQTGFSGMGRYKSVPCGLLSCMFDVNTKTIVDLDFSDKCDERAALVRMLGSAKAGDVVVMDRGYYSDSLAHALQEQGIQFVFRMKKNVGHSTFTRLGSDVYRTPASVVGAMTDYTLNGNRFRLFHSMRTPRRQARQLYKQRWDVEEAFKTLKCTVRLNAKVYRVNCKESMKKQMWVCATLHRLQQLVASPRSKSRPASKCNGVQIVCWFIHALCSGQATTLKVLPVYSTLDRRRR